MCTFLARRSAKLIANFSATMVTSLPSFSLSLYLSLSLSLSHRMYLTHNIGSASALPIIDPGPPCELLCGPDNVTSLKLCNFQPVTKHDVERTLLSFASSKSPGPDGICSSELKLAAKTISGMLTILFNESLATGEVPSPQDVN